MPKPWANLQMTFSQLEQLPLKRFFFFAAQRLKKKTKPSPPPPLSLSCHFIGAVPSEVLSSKTHFNNHLCLQTVNELSSNEKSLSFVCTIEKCVLKLQGGGRGLCDVTKFMTSPPVLLLPCFCPLSNILKGQQSINFSRKLKSSVFFLREAVNRGLNMWFSGDL